TWCMVLVSATATRSTNQRLSGEDSRSGITTRSSSSTASGESRSSPSSVTSATITTGTSVPLKTSELMISPRRSRAPLISQTSPRRTAASIELCVDHRDLFLISQRGVLVVEAGFAHDRGVRLEDLPQRALLCGTIDPGGQRNAIALGPVPGIGDRLVRKRQSHLGGHNRQCTAGMTIVHTQWNIHQCPPNPSGSVNSAAAPARASART